MPSVFNYLFLIVAAFFLAVFPLVVSSSKKSNAVCTTRSQLLSNLARQASKKPSAISVVYSAELNSSLDDLDYRREVCYDAGIQSSTGVRSSVSDETYIWKMSGITYLTAVTCNSSKKLKRMLRKAKGKDEFSFRPSAKLYSLLKKNNWELLNDIEGQVGLYERKLEKYQEPLRVITYSKMRFATNFFKVSSIKQVKKHFYASASKGKRSIAFYCSPTLYSTLLNEKSAYNTSILGSIASGCGIPILQNSFSTSRKLITCNELKYSPGVHVYHLAKKHRLSQLTTRERTLYDRAKQIVKSCKKKSSNTYELIMSLCEYIATHSHYEYGTEKEYSDFDNAYGVLLQGKGECDSYSDAFYLVGNLAGLKVGLQHGRVTKLFNSNPGDSCHIWNTITLNKKTYFLDMTAADGDNKKKALDVYYIAIGRDIARHLFIWDEKLSKKRIASSSSKKYFPFYREKCVFHSSESAQYYIRLHKNDSLKYVSLMLVNTRPSRTNDAFLKQVVDHLNLKGTYNYRHIDKYSFLTFYYK